MTSTIDDEELTEEEEFEEQHERTLRRLDFARHEAKEGDA